MTILAKYLRLGLILAGVATILQSQGLPVERFADCANEVLNGREQINCKLPVGSSIAAATTAVMDNASGIVTATFYPEEEINVPATGEPISIYRVDVKAEAAALKINAIDVFRAWPALVPMTKERATVELATKTERGILRTASRLVAMTASAGAVVAGVRSFVRSTNPALDTRNDAKWAMAGAATAFLAQYAPQLAGQLAGAAPVYRVPEDALSAGAFDLAAGEARTFHVVARGRMQQTPFTGVVR